ncbi:hypothetical protein ABZ914_08330 [Spirillospora sp. NPDC046719]
MSSTTQQIAAGIEQSRHRQVRTVDIRPPAAGDGSGLSSFYLVIGWIVGGYLAAAILGVGGGGRPANLRRTVIRLGSLALYAIVSGLGGPQRRAGRYRCHEPPLGVSNRPQPLDQAVGLRGVRHKPCLHRTYDGSLATGDAPAVPGDRASSIYIVYAGPQHVVSLSHFPIHRRVGHTFTRRPSNSSPPILAVSVNHLPDAHFLLEEKICRSRVHGCC